MSLVMKVIQLSLGGMLECAVALGLKICCAKWDVMFSQFMPRSAAGAPLPGRGGRLSPGAAARGLVPPAAPSAPAGGF